MEDSGILAIYDDFSGGYYDPGARGMDMPAGTWGGLNVLVHSSGMLMLRRGITDLTSTNSDLVSPTAAGRGGNNDLYFVGDNEAIYQWDTNMAGSASGRFPGTDQIGMLFADNFMYVGTSGTTGLHRYDGTTYTNVNTSVRGTCLAVFRDRLYVGGDLTGTGYRIWYSEPADYDNFPVTNFLDVPPAFGRVQSMHVFNDQLVIGMQNAIPEVPRWWILTDSPENGGSLQEVGNGPFPHDFRAVAKIQEGIIVAATDGLFIYQGGREFKRIDNIITANPIALQTAGGGQITVSEDGYSCLIGANGYLYHYNGHSRRWSRHVDGPGNVNWQAGMGKLMTAYDSTSFALFRDTVITGSNPYYIASKLDLQDNEWPVNAAQDVYSGSNLGDVSGQILLPPMVAPPGKTFDIRGIGVELVVHGASPSLLTGGTSYDTTYISGSAITASFTTTTTFGIGDWASVYHTLNTNMRKCKRFQPELFIENTGILRVKVYGTLEHDRETR